MSNSLCKPAALLLCAMPCMSPAWAAEHTLLNDQLVTATRTAQTAEQSLAAVTVFDRAQIEQSQATSLPELLKKVPGVSLANNGGPGQNSALYMRGTNSNHVLVLIDG
ncbi:TonB-dependent receptor plug domain-containing protein, partial [Pseudomonas sp.]|uniref:TonB-dependent receptor plug domain-containing protein n=1 Tax=Pseudomonas sp. TaxID=306 RepID=UPI0035649B69